jgi:MFS family permease
MIDLLINIGAIFKDRMKRAGRRHAASALMIGFALLFIGVALVAVVAALGVALAALWGMLAACLIIAGAAVLLAALLVVIAAQQEKEARRQQQADLAELRQTLLAVRGIAADVTQNKALMVATIFGLLVGLKATKREPRNNA